MRPIKAYLSVALMICTAAVAWSDDSQQPQPLEAESASSSTPDAAAAQDAEAVAVESSPKLTEGATWEERAEEPWDYSPYRVLIWLASDDPSLRAADLQQSIRAYLDRDFAAVWRVDLTDAPVAVRSAAFRDMKSLTFDGMTAADPVLAVKRDHPDAVRIRTADNVGQLVKKVFGSQARIDDVTRRAEAAGDKTISGVADRLEAVDGDTLAVRDLWADEATEALLVSRGMAMTLSEPEAKLITTPLDDLVSEAVDAYDKIFVVRIRRSVTPNLIDAIELDTLMRYLGPVASSKATEQRWLPNAIGRAMTQAFAPVVRIENAGQKSAVGLLRAGGLVLKEKSPAAIGIGDVLQPMTRKNDRNGRPILIGEIDWAYLLATEFEGRYVKMDYYAGRAGGLQGRKNKRTFRTALKVRPLGDSSVLRLHLQRDPNFPLIGYELYQKELKSTNMTFIGRTDWNGRLEIERTDDPLRLLYVKNGGAVLARLPIVPGLNLTDVADLSGDDLRLQAEAYIRGVQNAIIDLVAIRELFKARIRLRLERGEMEKAETLMNALRDQPSNEKLANDMGKRQAIFLKLLGTRNANQRRKVDEMFTTTRDLLAKHINPKLVRDLEADVIAARKNGGKLPPRQEEPEEEDEGGAGQGKAAKNAESKGKAAKEKASQDK